MSTSMDITDAVAAPTNIASAAVSPDMPALIDTTIPPLIDTLATSSNTNTATRPWVPMGCTACNNRTGVTCSTHAEQINQLLAGRENKELTKGEKVRMNREVSEARWFEKQGQREQRQEQIREKQFLKAFDFMSLNDTKNNKIKRDQKIQRRKERKMALDGPNTALKAAKNAHGQELERRKAKNKAKAKAQDKGRNPHRGARGQSFLEIIGTGTEEFFEHEEAEEEEAEGSGDFLTRAAELIQETLKSPENIISTRGRNNLTEALSLIQTTHLLYPDQNTSRTGERFDHAPSPLIFHQPLEDFRSRKAIARQNYVHTPHGVPGSPKIHPSRMPLMLQPGETPLQQNVAPQEYQSEGSGANRVNFDSSVYQNPQRPSQRHIRFGVPYSEVVRSQSNVGVQEGATTHQPVPSQDMAMVKQKVDEDMEL